LVVAHGSSQVPANTAADESHSIVAAAQDAPASKFMVNDSGAMNSDERQTVDRVLGKPAPQPSAPAAGSPAPAPRWPEPEVTDAEPPRLVHPQAPAAPKGETRRVVLTGFVEETNSTKAAPVVSPNVPASLPASVTRPDLPSAPTPIDMSPPGPPPTGRDMPLASDVRLVNSKRISLNYELKDVGHSGITEVELWCTRDGRTWKKRDTLPQGAKPPCVVEVDDEDLVGFTLVVRTAAGLGRQPQEGDRPQVWVEADVTSPAVRLLGVEMGKVAAGRQMTILWKAADKNIGPRPITLLYAAQAEGPWLPIATELDNTGRFVWEVPEEVPHRLFVRLQAADLVGNLGIAQTPQPLLDDLAQPSATITKVEATQN
jgi:hypothetical protein